jgi:hypothetical protein
VKKKHHGQHHGIRISREDFTPEYNVSAEKNQNVELKNRIFYTVVFLEGIPLESLVNRGSYQ